MPATVHATRGGSSIGEQTAATTAMATSISRPLTRSAKTLRKAGSLRPDPPSRYQARTTSPPTEVGSTRLKNMPT